VRVPRRLSGALGRSQPPLGRPRAAVEVDPGDDEISNDAVILREDVTRRRSAFALSVAESRGHDLALAEHQLARTGLRPAPYFGFAFDEARIGFRRQADRSDSARSRGVPASSLSNVGLSWMSRPSRGTGPGHRTVAPGAPRGLDAGANVHYARPRSKGRNDWPCVRYMRARCVQTVQHEASASGQPNTGGRR
jgi:hypothetical protein